MSYVKKKYINYISIWTTENGTLYNGDCLEVMQRLGDKSVDLLLTDPPYGIKVGKLYKKPNLVLNSATNTTVYENLDWDSNKISNSFFAEMFRVSKKQIIFGGNYYADILPITNNWIVWDKKTEDKYSNGFSDFELAWCSGGGCRIFRYLWSGMIQQDMKNKEQRFHPTQKPVGLFEKILDKYSQENETILDCFLGSGTTALACENLNRKWIGIELSKDYCEIAKKRLIENNRQAKLF